jgi:Icc-related predicted phosphoesterase
MRVLVCNDLHLKPGGSDYDLSAMGVPEDLDAALVAGDLTHRAGEDDVALARRFVEGFAPDVPVFYVPGNHDHAPMPDRVVDGLGGASSGHEVVRECDAGAVVGWGCERRSLDPALDQTAFESLDPRTEPRGERRYAADWTADRIEDALLDVVTDRASARDAADGLDIAPDEEGSFLRSVDTVQSNYDHLAGLVDDRQDVLLVTHLSPFNTSFDRHHSTGTRETDLEGLHTGSIALKLVARTHDVYATISGHSHDFGYDTGNDTDEAPHMLNLGFRGLGVVDVDPAAGAFSFTDANPG